MLLLRVASGNRSGLQIGVTGTVPIMRKSYTTRTTGAEDDYSNVAAHRIISRRSQAEIESLLDSLDLIGLRDIVGFDGTLVTELKSRSYIAVDHYLWACEQLGQTAEKPNSGRMMVRVAPDLHAKATLAAKTAGKSLNQWVSQAPERAIEA